MKDTNMRHAIRTLAVVLLALPLLNCSLYSKAALREGHRLYKEGSFSKAIEEYKIVLNMYPDSAEGIFYTGSSYHQLFVPGKDSTRANLDEAIKNYTALLALQAPPDDERYPILKKNALSALIGIYAEDPYRDLDKSLKYASELTGSDPGNLQNLFAMGNLYEKFGKVNEAEAAYKKAALEVAPKDPKACGALATFYNKTLWDEKGVPVTEGKPGRGRFMDAVNQLKICADLDPKDPKGYYTVATFYWDQCYRGPLLEDARKKQLADEGMEFINKSLAINPEFVEGLVYKGLLLREQAKLTKNPGTRNSLMVEAQALQKKAVELKKKQDAKLAEEALKAAAAAALASS